MDNIYIHPMGIHPDKVILDGVEQSKPDDHAGKVPIRLGGPWRRGKGHWEIWYGGKFLSYSSRGWSYYVRDGEFHHTNNNKPFGCQVTPSHELHAPKGWPKPGDEVPEGCYVLNPSEPEILCKTCQGNGECVDSPSRVAPCRNWYPKDKPDEGKFKVGDRVRWKTQLGTVVGPSDGKRCDVQWDCLLKTNDSLVDLEHLPASEDPLPRKEGVIVYEVTQEEFPYALIDPYGPWCVTKSDRSEGIWHLVSKTEMQGHLEEWAKPGETWVIYRS